MRGCGSWVPSGSAKRTLGRNDFVSTRNVCIFRKRPSCIGLTVPQDSLEDYSVFLFHFKWFAWSSKQNGIEGTFGWLQAPATMNATAFRAVAFSFIRDPMTSSAVISKKLHISAPRINRRASPRSSKGYIKMTSSSDNKRNKSGRVFACCRIGNAPSASGFQCFCIALSARNRFRATVGSLGALRRRRSPASVEDRRRRGRWPV